MLNIAKQTIHVTFIYDEFDKVCAIGLELEENDKIGTSIGG